MSLPPHAYHWAYCLLNINLIGPQWSVCEVVNSYKPDHLPVALCQKCLIPKEYACMTDTGVWIICSRQTADRQNSYNNPIQTDMQTDRQRNCNNPSAYVRNCCIYIINPKWLGLMHVLLHWYNYRNAQYWSPSRCRAICWYIMVSSWQLWVPLKLGQPSFGTPL